jgi:ubiquinol-cytochrome c reductase cytochrome c subunit
MVRKASAAVLLLVSAFAAGAAFAPAASAQTPGQTDRAPQLYLEDCSYCHGAQGEGTRNGPSLTGVGTASADFMISTGRMPIDGADTYPQRAQSPYTVDEQKLLVSYIAGLGSGPPVPEVDLAAGDLVRGQQLYADNCASCHGTTGIGAALTDTAPAPSLNLATPVQIAEAMRIGGIGKGGSMPVFGPDTIDQAQLDDIVRYVVYLQNPTDRGGGGLAHLGPLAEGAMGLLVGLGAALLLARLIGEKADLVG